MKAHFEKELYFENENVFLEKWKVTNHLMLYAVSIGTEAMDAIWQTKTIISASDVRLPFDEFAILKMLQVSSTTFWLALELRAILQPLM